MGGEKNPKRMNDCMPLLCIGWHRFSEQVLSSDSCFSSYLPDMQIGDTKLDLKIAIHVTFVHVASNHSHSEAASKGD